MRTSIGSLKLRILKTLKVSFSTYRNHVFKSVFQSMIQQQFARRGEGVEMATSGTFCYIWYIQAKFIWDLLQIVFLKIRTGLCCVNIYSLPGICYMPSVGIMNISYEYIVLIAHLSLEGLETFIFTFLITPFQQIRSLQVQVITYG